MILFQEFDAGTVFSLFKIVHEDEEGNTDQKTTQEKFTWRAVVNIEEGIKVEDSEW